MVKTTVDWGRGSNGDPQKASIFRQEEEEKKDAIGWVAQGSVSTRK
jgi:hypothetical protein